MQTQINEEHVSIVRSFVFAALPCGRASWPRSACRWQVFCCFLLCCQITCCWSNPVHFSKRRSLFGLKAKCLWENRKKSSSKSYNVKRLCKPGGLSTCRHASATLCSLLPLLEFSAQDCFLHWLSCWPVVWQETELYSWQSSSPSYDLSTTREDCLSLSVSLAFSCRKLVCFELHLVPFHNCDAEGTNILLIHIQHI